MQGFDEFVASSPALSAKYNMVTQKYVERMAKGGLTRKERSMLLEVLLISVFN